MEQGKCVDELRVINHVQKYWCTYWYDDPPCCTESISGRAFSAACTPNIRGRYLSTSCRPISTYYRVINGQCAYGLIHSRLVFGIPAVYAPSPHNLRIA